LFLAHDDLSNLTMSKTYYSQKKKQEEFYQMLTKILIILDEQDK